MDSIERVVYIYALVDPRTDEVRYVGQSVKPSRRLSQHRHEARNGATSPATEWLRELDALGLQPSIHVLEECVPGAEVSSELRWIVAMSADGALLLNKLRPSSTPVSTRKPLRPCAIEDCPRAAVSRGWCSTHYERWRDHGDPLITVRAANGEGSVWAPRGYRLLTIDGKRVQEHRVVMERLLGRPLARTEVVHHLNGNKSDNRVENLELLVNQSAHRKEHARFFRSETHKQCSRCRRIKPRSEFAPNDPKGTGKDRNTSKCHACCREATRAWRKAHPRPSRST